jgi:hypothetical protein
MRVRRILAYSALAVLGAGIAAPYVDAEGYRARIQDALERALNRKVTVQKVRFNLFTGPGFTIEGVTIEEDPSLGIEPFAYVEKLEARVRLTSLWTRRLSFSNLRLKEVPTVNLAKSENGVWNFQLLLNQAPGAAARDFPSIEVRGGRINFKFGENKSVFYLRDADIDIDALDADRVQVWFSGQPARTDRAAQNFGRLLAKGIWSRRQGQEAHLDLTAELERSAMSEIAKLFDSNPIGVHGLMASRARIRGPISNLAISGQLKLDDIHRWDLMPAKSGGWNLTYRGTLDIVKHRLEVETTAGPDVPLIARFRATDYLSDPHWAASLELRDAPASAFVETARHMGAPLPDGVTLDGKLAGVVGYSRPGGLQGQFVLQNSAVQLPGASPVRVKSASVLIDGTRTVVGPATVDINDSQTAELSGAYNAGDSALDVRIETRLMDVAELHSGSGRLLGAGFVPVLENCQQGTWRGWVRYTQRGDQSGVWSGEFGVQNARVHLPGLAAPLRITSAAVTLDLDGRLFVNHMQGHIGEVRVRGDYRYDPGAARPERLRLMIPALDINEVEPLLAPTLRRPAGLLARFRFRSSPAPDWLKSRKLDGVIEIEDLSAGNQECAFHSRIQWDGVAVRLFDIDARHEDSRAAGELSADLSGAVARYRWEGKISGLDYKGGLLDVEGSVESRGTGLDLLANAQGALRFEGTDVGLAPDAEFQSLVGVADLLSGGRVHLSGVQASQSGDSYSGQGSILSDGRVTLELTSGRKQMRIASTLSSGQPGVR